MSAIRQTHSFVHRAMAAGAFAVVLAASGASHAADASATASGTVVTPIAISAAANLSFGNFAAGTGGTVTINTAGVRSATGVTAIGTGGSAARFDITGSPNLTYSITHAGSAQLTSGSDTMTLTKFSDLTGAGATSGNVASGTLSAGGTQSLFVGGTLTVGSGQAPGVYSGTIDATVEYN